MGTKELLGQAILTAQRGLPDKARELFHLVLIAEPRNENAWVWLAAIATNDAEREECLRQVVAINPKHPNATAELQRLIEKRQKDLSEQVAALSDSSRRRATADRSGCARWRDVSKTWGADRRPQTDPAAQSTPDPVRGRGWRDRDLDRNPDCDGRQSCRCPDCAYGDSNTDVDADRAAYLDAHADTDGDAVSAAHLHRHPDADADINHNPNADAVANRDAVSYLNIYAYAHGYQDRDAHTYGDGYVH